MSSARCWRASTARSWRARRADNIAQIAGNGNGGAAITTGWVLIEIPLGTLPAGTHTVTLGGYNNKKNGKSELTTILIDDVVVARQP